MNLVYLSEYFGLPEVASFWEAVVRLNNWHQKRISQLIIKKLFGTITGKKIAILGFAFKANTNDTRESSAINICKELMIEGGDLRIYDPKVKYNQIKKDLDEFEERNHTHNVSEGSWEVFDSFKKCYEEVDAIVIMTEWEEFKFINWEEVSKMMRKPSWVFDTRAILDSKKVKKYGLNFWSIGCGE